MEPTNGTQEPAEAKQKRQRSPSYPSDGLETCVKWARKIYEAEKRSTTSALVAVKHMGYSTLSGPARTGLSAMKKFGLLIEEGGEKVRISEEAVKLFLDPDEGSRLTLLRTLALKPEIIREFIQQHPDGLPSDVSLRFKLVTDRGFGEDAAGTLIKALRETVRFAKLEPGQYTPPSKEPPMEHQHEQPPPPPPGGPLGHSGGGTANRVVAGAEQPFAAATLHVWSLGGGVTVELRSSAPLSPKHFKRLSKYVELAAEAEEDDAGQDA